MRTCRTRTIQSITILQHISTIIAQNCPVCYKICSQLNRIILIFLQHLNHHHLHSNLQSLSPPNLSLCVSLFQSISISNQLYPQVSLSPTILSPLSSCIFVSSNLYPQQSKSPSISVPIFFPIPFYLYHCVSLSQSISISTNLFLNLSQSPSISVPILSLPPSISVPIYLNLHQPLSQSISIFILLYLCPNLSLSINLSPSKRRIWAYRRWYRSTPSAVPQWWRGAGQSGSCPRAWVWLAGPGHAVADTPPMRHSLQCTGKGIVVREM